MLLMLWFCISKQTQGGVYLTVLLGGCCHGRDENRAMFFLLLLKRTSSSWGWSWQLLCMWASQKVGEPGQGVSRVTAGLAAQGRRLPAET